jgi:hypothetical protein
VVATQFQERLALRDCRVNGLAHCKGNDFVIPAVHHQYRALQAAGVFRHRVAQPGDQARRQEWIEPAGHIDPRGKTGFDNHCRRCVLGAQPGADRAAQGTAKYDDPVGRDATFIDQVVPGRLCIEIRALLRRLAAALTVAPVVNDQCIHSQLVEDLDAVQAMGDIAGIAVKKQHHATAADGRHIPAMQFLTIAGGNGNVFELKPEIAWRGGQRSPWHVRQKHHFALQQVKRERQQQVDAGGEIQQTRQEFHGASCRCGPGSIPSGPDV